MEYTVKTQNLGRSLLEDTSKSKNLQKRVISMISTIETDRELDKFWEFEEINQFKQLTRQESECEKGIQETTVRNDDGTNTVRIPFKDNPDGLKVLKVARCHQLEKRFRKYKDLERKHKNVMEEYLKLGHMSLVIDSSESMGKYYIPHHKGARPSDQTESCV